MDCTLQHTSVNQVGTNYPYRPIWTLYFYQGKGKVVLQSQLFLKDVKPLGQMNRNLVGSVYGWSSIKIAHFITICLHTWPLQAILVLIG
jgi:hypothetical protein